MLIGPAHTHRYRRFADALTGAHARLAEKRGWLVLRFSGLSPPILCQLAWRTVPPSYGVVPEPARWRRECSQANPRVPQIRPCSASRVQVHQASGRCWYS